MWAIIKIDIKKISTLKSEFINKIGGEVLFYSPKLKLKQYTKSKVCSKEIYLLGNYILCFHKDFGKQSVVQTLKYSKGLKYFLNNLNSNQNDIENFITKCKEHEDENGFIKQTFFNFKSYKKFKFLSGPFTDFMFTIINENKSTIKALIGKYKVTMSKEKNFFRPI